MPQRSRTFKTALRTTRKAQEVSLQELGLRIESDASHAFKLEHGHDVTLSTMLKLAAALGTTVQFGSYVIVPEPGIIKRQRRKPR